MSGFLPTLEPTSALSDVTCVISKLLGFIQTQISTKPHRNDPEFLPFGNVWDSRQGRGEDAVCLCGREHCDLVVKVACSGVDIPAAKPLVAR